MVRMNGHDSVGSFQEPEGTEEGTLEIDAFSHHIRYEVTDHL